MTRDSSVGRATDCSGKKKVFRWSGVRITFARF